MDSIFFFCNICFVRGVLGGEKPIGKSNDKKREMKNEKSDNDDCICGVFGVDQPFPAAVDTFHPNWLPAQSKWVLHLDQALFAQTKLHEFLVQNPDLRKNSSCRFHAQIMDELNLNIDKDNTALTVVGLDSDEAKNQVMVIVQANFDQKRSPNISIKKLKNLHPPLARCGF